MTEPILELLEPRLLLDSAAAEQVVELFDTADTIFAENQGQWSDESVRYAFDGNRVNVLFTDTGPVFQLFKDESVSQFSAQFNGANSVSPVGLEQSRTIFNYHIGDQSDWRDGVATYASVAYMNLYDGVDLHTWGQRDHLKYEFRVSPGADFSQISISYSGIDSLAVDDAGVLRVALPGGLGEVVDNAPYIYQIIGGVEVQVGGTYRLIDADTYTFEITGDYVPTAQLIIDPELDWSTYLGGNSGDRAYGIATDSGGASLVAGYTWSRGCLSGGWDTSFNGGGDAFTAKFDAAGEHLWSTYLGGSSADYGYGIATDASDNVLVTGRTQSSGWVSGGWLSDMDGSSDGFVVKLNSAGGHVWSSYLGGSSWDEGHGVAADASGGVLVTGSTESSGWVAGGWKTSYSGGRDVFAVKLSAAGEHLWSTYLGGGRDDRGYGIAVDAVGDALVTGYTHSPGWVSGGWNDTHGGGGGDSFVVKLSAAGGHIWSTYLGGSSTDYGYGIAVDADGYTLVTGYTNSSDWVSGGWSTDYRGQGDGFVVKLDAVGGHVWSTYLGGSSTDYGYGIAVDSSGNALVAGYTGSNDWISSGLDTSYGGAYDGFVVKLSTAGGHLWSTYLGGSEDDRAHGIAVDANGGALVTGEIESPGWASGGNDTTHNGFADAFVAKLTGVVTFSDPGLEQALRDALNKSSGYLTDDNLVSLTGLDASSRGITNLEGLQNCTNLTDLNLSGNQFTDLQGLLDSTALNAGDTVTVTGNPLSSLACVVQIPALEARGVTVEYIIPVGAVSDIVGRYIFYNNSASDLGGPIANVNDDDAIAPDKAPLLSGGIPRQANYTNYWRGINGIMVDIDRLFASPTGEDFRIRVTESASPDTWFPGPTPMVTARPGEGVGGSDRVTLTWAGGEIINQWIEITMPPGNEWNMVDTNVFYFGNAVGDCDGDGQVGDSDYESFVSQFGRGGDGQTADFDKNGQVDLADFAIMRTFYGNTVAPPPILTGDADGSGVVDDGDYAILIGQFGRSGDGLATDFNGDERVDLVDFSILRECYGNTLVLPSVLPGDADQNGVVDNGDLEILIGDFGLTGTGLTADFDGDRRVALEDFGILRDNFGNTLPAAPAVALQAAGEPITAVAAPVASVVSHPLDDRDAPNANNASEDPIATAAFEPAIDLLAELTSAAGYVSGLQEISAGRPAATQQRAATAEYDLRPLRDDPPAGETDELLAGILAESPPAVLL